MAVIEVLLLDADLDEDLGNESHIQPGAAVHLGSAELPAEAFAVDCCHAKDPYHRKRGLHSVKLCWLYNRFNHVHDALQYVRTGTCHASPRQSAMP